MRLCHRSQRRFCSKKGEDISVIKNRKKGGFRVFKESVKKRVYLTTKIITNITSVLCAKEGWKKEDSVRLSIFEQLDN